MIRTTEKLFKVMLIACVSLSLVVQVHAQDEDDLPWWRERVFYEIFVRSFYDSDGDGVGDIRGIIEKLDYLNDGDPTTDTDLGITGIWLMPIMESGSYHGYDTIDFYQIEQDYGTNEDFIELVEAANERGIVIIVDLVLNHTSNNHPWFIKAKSPDSEYRDWYIWTDEELTYRSPWNSTVWYAQGDHYYYGLFSGQQVDLNYENPEVTQAMYEIARFWLEDMQVAGFRLDAVKHLIEDGTIQENTPATYAWLQDFNNYLDEINPDALTVGEIFGDPTTVVAEYVNTYAVDTAFDFSLADAMMSNAQNGSARMLRRAQRSVLNAYENGNYAAFLTNHDQTRVISQMNGDRASANVAATLLLTQPGLPFIYYGEEIGMLGAKPDPRIRTPMHWDDTARTAGFTSARQPYESLSAGYRNANVAVQNDDPQSLLNHYRALIHLRNQYPALQTGTWQPVIVDNDAIYSFLRQNDDQTIMVIVNLRDEPISDFAITPRDIEDFAFTSAEILYDNSGASTGTQITFDVPQSISAIQEALPSTLEAKSSYILELNTP